MKILFKYPSRSRPQIFRSTLDKYYASLSGTIDCIFIVTLDNDDEAMNTPEMRNYLDTKQNLRYYYGDSKSKVEAINANVADAGDWDIVVLLSDDMIPVESNIDVIISHDLTAAFPDLDGAIYFDDGRQGQNLASMVIMGRPVYDHWGYIYNPCYTSLFCDDEYQAVLQNAGKLKYVDRCIIRHEWVDLVGWDTLMRKNGSYMESDGAIYQSRLRDGFPSCSSY